MVSRNSVKIDITADDKASKVFDDLGKTVASRMNEINKRADGATTALSDVAEVTGELAKIAPEASGGLGEIAMSLGKVAEGATKASDLFSKAMTIFKWGAGIGAEAAGAAGAAVAVAGYVVSEIHRSNVALAESIKLHEQFATITERLRGNNARNALDASNYRIDPKLRQGFLAEAYHPGMNDPNRAEALIGSILSGLDSQRANAGGTPGEQAANAVRAAMEPGVQTNRFSRDFVEQQATIAQRKADELAATQKQVNAEQTLLQLRKQLADVGKTELERALDQVRASGLTGDKLQEALELRVRISSEELRNAVQDRPVRELDSHLENRSAPLSMRTGPNLLESRFLTRAPGGLSSNERIQGQQLDELKRARQAAEETKKQAAEQVAVMRDVARKLDFTVIA